ncbi:hypothetical protein VB735_26945 [Halotia wernerae UHCC 0503]|nr:hypothetical protein [Halotia wernerae UHCC 0503]
MTDPVSEAVLEISNALKTINPAAAEDFIKLYLGDSTEDEK